MGAVAADEHDVPHRRRRLNSPDHVVGAADIDAEQIPRAVPVFVDIEPRTLNVDPAEIERAVTPRTRAIVPVHYAGVGCEMDAILEIARRANAVVIEDAAQALLSTWGGRPLGSFGATAALCPTPRLRVVGRAQARVT